VREALATRRIQTSVHYPPIHSFTAFRELSRRPLPRTDALAERILTLPLYPHLSDEQVGLVAEELVSAVRASSPRARAAG
jgi:dTDP-4-amino-4,6-dideoxygalactose transaminase